jgi:hypothetical protein
MIITGEAKKDGNWFAVLMPDISAFTQARTRGRVFAMAMSCIRDLLDRPHLEMSVRWVSEFKFEVSVDDGEILPRALQTARIQQGLTLLQASALIGSRSPNAWKRYETPGCDPTLRQIGKLMHAVGLSSSLSSAWRAA